jgi:iron-sulfur cluster repair protein YtfE (RIC family)
MTAEMQHRDKPTAGIGMDTISGYLGTHHRRCDQLCIEAEKSVAAELWDRADGLFHEFCAALEQHFAMEEDVLFAAFEKAIHGADGPTGIMRVEHKKINSVVFMLRDALERRARNAFLGHADTLNIMIAQHNQVEEDIFYPMIDRMFSSQKHDIIEAMRKIAEPPTADQAT